MTDRDGGGCEPWWGLPSAIVGEVVADEPLSGGAVNDVRRLTLADGTRVVLKSSEQAPPDLYAQEAEGLRVLREQGGLRTPRVIEVSARHLLLEALEPAPADGDAFWAEAGRAVARLHAVRGDRFGWHAEGWLGLLPRRTPGPTTATRSSPSTGCCATSASRRCAPRSTPPTSRAWSGSATASPAGARRTRGAEPR